MRDTETLQRQLTFDLRNSWQVRSIVKAKGTTAAVLLSVLAHTYDGAMEAILEAAFPGFSGISAPFLCTAGKVAKNGTIVADVVNKDGSITKDAVLYKTEIELRDDFRRLADRMKLSDADRVELFKCVQRWVVADRRLDPTFDPHDPDAKRLVN